MPQDVYTREGDPTNETDRDRQPASYRAKRSPDRTPEPVGAVSPSGRLFVVHKHAATALHFDLRLEMDGVLKSWAVPKGPSYDLADKRLAVHVEDHPIEYGDFEGVIPDGQLRRRRRDRVGPRRVGAARGPRREGLEKGKLLFELHGYKLRGKWTLVKIKKSEKEWLLIKERDACVKAPGDRVRRESVLSGLTVEELKAGASRAARSATALEELGAPRRARRRADVEAHARRDARRARSRATAGCSSSSRRLSAARRQGGRRGAAAHAQRQRLHARLFPRSRARVAALPFDDVHPRRRGRRARRAGQAELPRLQQRGRLTAPLGHRAAPRSSCRRRSSRSICSAFEDFDLRGAAARRRARRCSSACCRKLGAAALRSTTSRSEGEALFARSSEARPRGHRRQEGATRPIAAGARADWLKIKRRRTGDFVVVGYTAPKGSAAGFGALQLARTGDGRARLRGPRRHRLHRQRCSPRSSAQLEALRSRRAAGRSAAPRRPETRRRRGSSRSSSCEVRYQASGRRTGCCATRRSSACATTSRRRVRAARAIRRSAEPAGDAEPARIPRARHRATAREGRSFSNLDKVYWPAEGYTKGDLIEYYRAISPWLLPYLRTGPLVMTRFPDGIDGKSFYQKDAPEFAPEWVRTRAHLERGHASARSTTSSATTSSRCSTSRTSARSRCTSGSAGSARSSGPTGASSISIPRSAPFSDVVTIALALHDALRDDRAAALREDQRRDGLHVLMPLGAAVHLRAVAHARRAARARHRCASCRDIATITRRSTKRGGKVYLDYLQNGHGQMIVAPFSVRPLPGAPRVDAARVARGERGPRHPRVTRSRTLPQRMEQLGSDPLAPVLTTMPDLVRALQRLQERL